MTSSWMLMATAWATLQGLRIEGMVGSAEREPAVRGQVFATMQGLLPPYDAVTLAKCETDRAGRFVLAIPEDWVRSPHFKHITLWAWMPGRALSARGFSATEIPAGDPVELNLGPPADQVLRILDADGKPVTGASVVPIWVDLGSSREHLPAELVDLVGTRTNEEGRATIDAWQLPSVAAWRVESGVGGTQQIQDFDQRPPEWATGELKLAQVGRVAVNVEKEEGAEDAPSTAIRVQTFSSTGTPGGRSTRGNVHGMICAGLTELGTLVAGGNLVEIECDPDSQIRPVLWPAEVEVGQTAELKVRWKPGLLVKGRVVERETKVPIPNARLSWFQYPCARRILVTDAEGRFHVRAFGGAAAIEDVDAPSPHLGVHDFSVYRYKLADDLNEQELPDIELIRGTSLRGIVLNSSGNPVPGAWIAAQWHSPSAVRGPFQDRCLTTVADDRGGFVLDPVEAGAALEIVAHFHGASSSKPEKVEAGKSGPIELRIEPYDLVSLRGRVVDQDGRPVPGAEIETWRASPENVIGGEKLVGSVSTTGADGRFQTTRALSREESCCVRVSAPGKVLQRSAWMKASAEEPLEIVLPSLARLTGSVRASDGQPVVGAHVAVCGDAPQPTENTTDEQGRFCLESILPGRVFLLIEADGRRFGRIVDASGGTLEWRLDAVESPLRTLSPIATRERELEIARAVLEPRVRRAIESKKPDDIYRVLSEQAWVAPDLALASVEAGIVDGYRADFVRLEAASGLLSSRIDDSMAVLSLVQGSYSRAYRCLQVAESVPERERKIELLTEAAIRAQEVQDPAERLTVLSHVAVVLFRLGERDSARKIIEGATSVAESLPAEEWAGFARGRFAEALCLFDLDRALAIVDGLKDSFARVRHRGNIAHRLAALDPEAAERVLCTQIRKDRSRDWDRWIPRVCHDMASVDRARALALADTVDGSDRAQALGWIALAIANSDPAAANALLDKAIGALRGEISRGGGSNAAATAASLLPIVEQVDSSRVREFLWRAMSLRAPRPVRDPLQREQQPFATDAQLALLVARYDREVARELLRPLVEHLKLGDPHRYSDWATDALPAALAVTDPEWALSLAGTLLPERASSTIAAVLARSGEERWRFVQDKYLNLWVVGKEDL